MPQDYHVFLVLRQGGTLPALVFDLDWWGWGKGSRQHGATRQVVVLVVAMLGGDDAAEGW